MVTYDSGSASFGGFHLGGCEELPRPASVSSLSLYKQKLDALFDDSRSFVSHTPYGTISDKPKRDDKVNSCIEAKRSSSEDDNSCCLGKIKKINNTVQDRIERMFADMAGESTHIPENIGVHVFNIHYLGSTPLHSKVTSLAGLQEPLRDLYFAYKRNFRQKCTLTGRLEISKSGLKVKYKGDKGDLEQLNPFPTIAVWSAVKFIVRTPSGENNGSYAFVPLITDPDNIDRHTLFKPLDESDRNYILSNNENSHSPLFAVVMRKIGVAKQLECHGFVCQTTEDAIVIAATLYKSLMSHMSRQGHNNNKKLRNRNGISCMSIASSIPANELPIRPPRTKRSASSLSGDSDRADGNSVNESFTEKTKSDITKIGYPLPHLIPFTGPHFKTNKITVDEVKAKLDLIKNNDTSSNSTRNSKNSITSDYRKPSFVQNQNQQCSNESSVRTKVSEKIELFRELERKRNIQRPPTLPPPIPTKSLSLSQTELSREPLRRSQSLRKSLSESGDILTKVAIPRSGSFLNAGGLTRYKSIGQRNNGKKGGGSPLGFSELFNEFKVQENLHSMDDILDAIIDPEGMSFNDLKPIYKEFLLKLAVTLTKDEIFQHSKAIMKKQKKRVTRKNSTFQIKRKKIFKGASGLRMVFRLPFGKDLDKREKSKQSLLDGQKLDVDSKQISESSVSTSSYDIRQFRPKEPALPPPKRQPIRQRPSKRSDKAMHGSKRNGKTTRACERTSASEDSDFLTMSNRLGCQNRNSSSGYVSCSECDSDGCIDRCYCSLKPGYKSKCYCSAEDNRKEATKKKLLEKSCKECVREAYDYSLCSCDSESCADSNKCYCSIPRAPRAAQSLEQLRMPARRSYLDGYKAFDEYSGKTKTRSRSSRGRRTRSTDSLALDYELLLQNRPQDARARNMQRLTVRSTGAGSQDALSVKKSAEMAALFADVRLSQRTDVRSLAGGRRTNLPMAATTRPTPSFAKMFDHKPISRNASLEDTLGYFP